MRGIAALIVLFHHFAHLYYPSVVTGAGWNALLYPLIAGHESVMFFFVLSGFVLAQPGLRGKQQPYPVFLWRRVLRIYGPYLGALALAVAGCAIWHNRLGTIGWLAGTWGAQVDLHSLIRHVLFLGDYDYSRYNTAFWSLVYEMRISIVYPLLFLAATRLRARYNLLLIAMLTIAGNITVEPKLFITLEYAGVFLLGALLARNLEGVSSIYRSHSSSLRTVFLLVAFALYNYGHFIAHLGPLWRAGDLPVALGAAGLIIFVMNSQAAKQALNASIPAFLGRISYSFYLVHGTVLFALAAMFRTKVNGPEFFLLVLPSSILLAWAFYRGVEAPFTRMSRNVGRASVATAV